MIMRKKILAANWKMNLTHSEAESYLQSFLTEIGDVNDVEVVILGTPQIRTGCVFADVEVIVLVAFVAEVEVKDRRPQPQ